MTILRKRGVTALFVTIILISSFVFLLWRQSSIDIPETEMIEIYASHDYYRSRFQRERVWRGKLEEISLYNKEKGYFDTDPHGVSGDLRFKLITENGELRVYGPIHQERYQGIQGPATKLAEFAGYDVLIRGKLMYYPEREKLGPVPKRELWVGSIGKVETNL